MSAAIYRVLADVVLIMHLIFVVFVVSGGWLAWRWRQLLWLHVPAAIWGAAIEFGGWICPLTPLENWLRRAGGAASYPGAFVDRYLIPIVYPPELTRTVQILLGGVVVTMNLLAYGFILRSRAHR